MKKVILLGISLVFLAGCATCRWEPEPRVPRDRPAIVEYQLWVF